MDEPNNQHQISTVVIYRLGSLGDTIVALPCFHRIAASFPDARRLVLTNKPVSSKAAPLETILRDGGLIHGAIDYSIRTRDPGELIGLGHALRQTNADTLVYLGGGRGRLSVLRDVMMFRACGFRRIIGAPLSRRLERPLIDRLGREEPEAERLARCIAPLGPIDLEDPAMWDLKLTADELGVGDRVAARFGERPFLAVNTGGKVAEKDWGESAWAEMLAALSERHPHLGVLFLGASDDSDRADRLARRWIGSSVNCCGALSPRQSAAAVRHARAFVGHDSGPLHLAAAMGVPCLGLFGAYNRPRRWHPYGRKHQVIHDLNGVAGIEPAQVVSTVERILRGESAA